MLVPLDKETGKKKSEKDLTKQEKEDIKWALKRQEELRKANAQARR